MQKSLDLKLAEIHTNSNSNAFILADAKDADMAFGIAATGKIASEEDSRFNSLKEYRDSIRQNVQQGLIDIMLMSISTNELLTINERLFDESLVTPAVRANDTTDIHIARGSIYANQPARPFRTGLIDHAQYGKIRTDDTGCVTGSNLGLYSITFNNDADNDMRMLNAYREFRVEAEQKNFHHFLEVFDPNAPIHAIPDGQVGGFVNDLIVRSLAGVASPGRPLFLKMVYHGPSYMEELANYDPNLIPGVLGGSAGTTYDAFKLLAEAKKYGAKAALFGRKINNAEHQLSFIRFLRLLADGDISPEEAVSAYHGALQGLGISPHRSLDADMQLTSGHMNYCGAATTISIPKTPSPSPDE